MNSGIKRVPRSIGIRILWRLTTSRDPHAGSWHTNSTCLGTLARGTETQSNKVLLL